MRIFLGLLLLVFANAAHADFIEGTVVQVQELKPQADPANPNLILRTRKITIKVYEEEALKTVTIYSPIDAKVSDYSSSQVPGIELSNNARPVLIKKNDEVIMLVDRGGDGILRGHANAENIKLVSRTLPAVHSQGGGRMPASVASNIKD